MTSLKLAAIAVALLATAAGAYALHRAAVHSSVETAREQAQLDALDRARAEVEDQQGEDLAARAQLERQVDGLLAQSRAYAEERARLTADLARQQATGRALVERGSADDVVTFGRSLGLHPVKR